MSEYNVNNANKVNIKNYLVWCDEEVYELKKYSNHSHAFFQMVFVPRGRLKYSLNSKIIVLNAGDYFVIPPGKIHAPVGGQDSNDYKSIEIKLYLTPELDKLFSFTELPVITGVKTNIDELSRLMLFIVREWRMKQKDFENAIHQQLSYIAILLNRENFTELKKEAEKDVSLSENRKRRISGELKKYICVKYPENINFGELAKKMSISHSYLSEVFKEKTGVSPVEFLNTLRLDKAKELMKISELNFSQIAEKIGYQNVFYFSRIFKKKTGIVPSEYRSLLNEYLKANSKLKQQ